MSGSCPAIFWSINTWFVTWGMLLLFAVLIRRGEWGTQHFFSCNVHDSVYHMFPLHFCKYIMRTYAYYSLTLLCQHLSEMSIKDAMSCDSIKILWMQLKLFWMFWGVLNRMSRTISNCFPGLSLCLDNLPKIRVCTDHRSSYLADVQVSRMRELWRSLSPNLKWDFHIVIRSM